MELRNELAALVEEKRDQFVAVGDQVWSAAELGFKERQSSKIIMDVLQAEGFTLKSGLAGIPTAFSGSFGSGEPVIGFLGEFDALPGLSQKSGCAVQEALEPGGNGHGCGHNSLGAGSLAAAVALKDYMQKHSLPGTIVYFGCPGEEYGCGKAFMAREGCFDHLDCAFSWHPGDINAAMSLRSLANLSVFFSFKGKTAHASGAPHLGRSALDAAELMNVGVNYLREHVIPEARMHYAYNDVGGQAPNVVQDSAQLHYYIRAPRIEQAKEIFERVKKVAMGAAMMTETECTVRFKDGLCDYVPNQILTKILAESMQEVGSIPFDGQDAALASEFVGTLETSQRKASLQQVAMLGGGDLMQEYAQKPLFDVVMPYRNLDHMVMPASTDVGDASYVTPTAQLTASTVALGTQAHTWQFTAQGNTAIAHKGMLFAGMSMALAGAKILREPAMLKEIKEEYLAQTGGTYNCPFPDDVQPYLD